MEAEKALGVLESMVESSAERELGVAESLAARELEENLGDMEEENLVVVVQGLAVEGRPERVHQVSTN